MTWDATLPADSEDERLGDDRIREVKQDIQTALTTEGIFPGPTPATAPKFYSKIGYDSTANRPAGLAAYAGRWYFNTTTKTIQRQDASPAWADITPAQNLIPAGSVMVFYQASPPSGWTQVVDATIADRALRVSGGSGGVTGGSDSISSPPTHNHGSGTTGSTSLAAHSHSMTAVTVAVTAGAKGAPASTCTAATTTQASAAVSHSHALPSTSSVGWAPGYIDIVLGVKD